MVKYKKFSYRALVSSSIALALMPLSQIHAHEYPADRGRVAVFSLDAGYLPPAGTNTIGLSFVYNDWDELTGSDGRKRKPFDKVDATSRVAVLSYLRMTERKLFSADYGFGIVLPYQYTKIDHSMATPGGEIPIQGEYDGLYAAFVSPVILQWRDPTYRFNQNFMFTVGLPVGDFDGDNPANSAADYYSAEALYQFTYALGGGYEMSSALSYQYNFRNEHDQHPTTPGPEGRLQNGDSIAWNLALGKRIGPMSIGLSGYWHKQLQQDDIKGVPNYDGLQAEQVGVGPVLTYRDPTKPKLPMVTLKYMKGIESNDAVTGDFINLSLGFTF